MSSDEDRKLPGEIDDHNTTNNLGNEISLLSSVPPKKRGHRRAHSDITTLHDAILDLNVQDDSSGDDDDDGTRSEPVSSDETDDPMPSNKPQQQQQSNTSVAFDRNAGVAEVVCAPLENEDKHKQSMDVVDTAYAMSEIPPSSNGSRVIPLMAMGRRKVLSAEKLAEIALVDPRRVRRILSNRQSAARSKQRKIQYRMELEMKVNALKVEAASLTAHLVALQREIAVLDAENSELKLKSQSIQQQVLLQDALNDAIRKEIKYLKILNSDMMLNGELAARIGSFGIGQVQQLYANYNDGVNNFLSTQQLQRNSGNFQVEEYQLLLQQKQPGHRILHKDGNVAPHSCNFKME